MLKTFTLKEIFRSLITAGYTRIAFLALPQSVSEKMNKVVTDIKLAGLESKVESFVVYGSHWNGNIIQGDLDTCIVLNSRDIKVSAIKKILRKHFTDLDIKVYYLDELHDPKLIRDINTGTLCLDYFSCGTALMGRNIFDEHFQKLSRESYERALIDKMSDYILRLRRLEINTSDNSQDAARVYRKYLSRILADILLSKKLKSLSEIRLLSPELVFMLGQELGIIKDAKPLQNIHDPSIISKYIDLREELSLVVTDVSKKFSKRREIENAKKGQ